MAGSPGFDVTVIVPFFNRIGTIAECVQTTRQEGLRVETIVVVDSLSPFSATKVRHALSSVVPSVDFSMTVVQDAQRPGGPASNRNFGLECASGEFVAFLDDDDRFLPGKLQIQLDFMNDGGHSFTYTNYTKRLPNGEVVDVALKPTYLPNYCAVQLAHFDCGIAVPTVMLKRSSIPAKLFPEDLMIREDQVAWWKLAVSGNCPVLLARSLTEVVMTEMSLTRGHSEIASQVQQWPTVLRESRIPFSWKHKVMISRLIRIAVTTKNRWTQ